MGVLHLYSGFSSECNQERIASDVYQRIVKYHTFKNFNIELFDLCLNSYLRN